MAFAMERPTDDTSAARGLEAGRATKMTSGQRKDLRVVLEGPEREMRESGVPKSR